MPVYEYRCNACGKEFEYTQRMSDPDLVKCENCGKDALEKLISRTAFSLKGGGWYKDLYASSKPETKASGEGSSAPASTTPASTSSDSGSSSGGSTAAPAASSPAPASSGSSGSSSGGGSSGSSGGSSSGGGGTAAS